MKLSVWSKISVLIVVNYKSTRPPPLGLFCYITITSYINYVPQQQQQSHTVLTTMHVKLPIPSIDLALHDIDLLQQRNSNDKSSNTCLQMTT